MYHYIDKTKCDATIGDDNCCKPDKLCGVGEGDCDTDDDCSGDLKCGTDNCGTGFPSEFDCCQAEPGSNYELYSLSLSRLEISLK